MLEGIKRWNPKEGERLDKDSTNVEFLNAYITKHNQDVRAVWRQ